MKSTGNEAPLRGEAAWRAHKQGVAERNKAACERASVERGRREASADVQRRAAERAERAQVPTQPNRG